MTQFDGMSGPLKAWVRRVRRASARDVVGPANDSRMDADGV